MLPYPKWYDRKLIANPWFQPNQSMIQQEAYRISEEYGVQKSSKDKIRICRLHVDEQNDFTSPITAIDPFSGKITRYIPSIFQGKIDVPEWWNEGNNELIWYDGHDFNIAEYLSIAGGRLSVANAWNDTARSVEWDMKYAAAITAHAETADDHPETARFYPHFWQARPGNPYDLPPGTHPYAFMDGPDKPYPIIIPENCYHPKHNPKGCWQGIAKGKKFVDETWGCVNKVGALVLWEIHCSRYTFGHLLDPVVRGNIMHHNFMRGLIEAEPIWFSKGLTWRTEFFGVNAPEYEIPDDPHAQPKYVVLQLLEGFPEENIPPFDLVIKSGQARSHCTLKTMQQSVDHMEKTGRTECIENMIYLKDTSSDIKGFEKQTEEALKELEEKGIKMETTESFNLYEYIESM
jgi:nicotinamidase-related amidase